MQIGVVLGADGGLPPIKELISWAQTIEAKGIDNIWMPNIFSYDAISTLSLIGASTSKIQVGTAVTPTYPRHPTAIAQQALTAAAASDNRFILGIGLSHKIVIEDMLGFSYDKPAKHMREYLSVLMPAVRGEQVNFDGEQYSVHGIQFDVPGADHLPVVIAGLGPVMTKLAGQMADGTSTWMVGPKTMEDHIIASVRAAAQEAGKPDPLIVGGFPIVLTNSPDEAKAKIDEVLAIYPTLPSYRAMLDREGVDTASGIAIVGGENVLRSELSRLRDMGVTHFSAAIVPVDDGAYERTIDFLADFKS